MDKHVFDFINPGFSADTSAHCSLNVIVGTDGFSLLAMGKNDLVQALKSWNFLQKGRDFKDVETSLRTVFGSETIFSYPFSEIRCTLFNQNATLIPRRLFTPDDLPAYFKLLLLPGEYEFYHDYLPEFDCYLAYAVEPTVTRMCGQYFPEAKMSHLASPLLRNWREVAPPGDYEIYLNVRNQAAQIAVFDRQNLLFYNAFQYSKANDLLYFVLLAYDQFRLSPEEIWLTVSGNLSEDSDAFKVLYRYIQTVRFARLPGKMSLPEQLNGLPEHFALDLFCVATG